MAIDVLVVLSTTRPSAMPIIPYLGINILHEMMVRVNPIRAAMLGICTYFVPERELILGTPIIPI